MTDILNISWIKAIKWITHDLPDDKSTFAPKVMLPSYVSFQNTAAHQDK